MIDEKGQKLGIIDREKALEIARERNYDLVEVSANNDNPVCRLMDYGKYKYQQFKKEQKQKKNTRQKEIKNIRLSARIEDHDFAVKLKQSEKFLNKGHKIKIILMLKGREITHSERGLNMIENFMNSLTDFFKDKEGPTQERNIIQVILIPK